MQGIIFIGLQASGKSSFYKQNFSDTHLRLNLDMLKTRHREGILFNACLESKQACVIDNTNPSLEDRSRYIHQLKQRRFEVVGYYFASGLNVCLKRNAEREGSARIPDIGVRATRNKLVLPSFEEGFDRIHYVSLNDDGFSTKEWKDEI